MHLLEKKDKTLIIVIGDSLCKYQPLKYNQVWSYHSIKCRLIVTHNRLIRLGKLTITDQGTASLWNFENLY